VRGAWVKEKQERTPENPAGKNLLLPVARKESKRAEDEGVQDARSGVGVKSS